MKLIELIVEIFKKENIPLSQSEIFNLIEKSPAKFECKEYLQVSVPRSAISRQLSKFSSGSNPIFQKVKSRKYKLISEVIPENNLVREFDLHSLLATFAFKRFNAHCKTINAVKAKNRGNKINKWSNPDLVGIDFALFNLNDLLQSEVEKQGIISSQVTQFYSFELKLKIDRFNLTECYFQAVSNSSWANFGYLVVGDMDKDNSFISNLIRLNSGYGIGVICLNFKEPEKSEIIVSARERNSIDINFMNFLSSINADFYAFIKNSKKVIIDKKIKKELFDKV